MNNKKDMIPVIEIFKKEAKKIAGDILKKIILYGSRARYESHKSSDIDIALIFQKEPSTKIKNKIRAMSNSLSLQYDVVISEIFLTQSEFQRYQTPFLINIKKEGITL